VIGAVISHLQSQYLQLTETSSVIQKNVLSMTNRVDLIQNRTEIFQKDLNLQLDVVKNSLKLIQHSISSSNPQWNISENPHSNTSLEVEVFIIIYQYLFIYIKGCFISQFASVPTELRCEFNVINKRSLNFSVTSRIN
jgi:hypothetical protein